MLVASSLLFITNALAAFYQQYYLYGSLFVVLTATSVVVHSKEFGSIPERGIGESLVVAHNGSESVGIGRFSGSRSENRIENIIDKIAIFSVVFYGGRMLYTKQSDPESNPIVGAIIVLTFLFCIGVYYYGYICNKYCFDPDPNIGNEYHALLHIISSIGHHMIILV